MKAPLAGAGVLVTRPEHQAADLVAAVRAAGGRAIPFPVIDIEARRPADLAADLDTLPAADISVFVSRNAVEHGLLAVPPGSRIAAIGDATAEAVVAAGRRVDIAPAAGFDSEALLAEPALQNVAGLHVRIVRGNGGRELLGDTLRQRGAQVHYVEAYARRRHQLREADIATLESAWRGDGIHYVIVLSAATLEHLLGLLPDEFRKRLPDTRLVSPSERVIKTALDRIPRVRALLASSPRAEDIVAAMTGDWRTQTDHHK